MSKMIINNFDELINFLENNNLKKENIDLLLWHTLKVIAFYDSQEELIQSLKDYWSKWKSAETKPIFLGFDL